MNHRFYEMQEWNSILFDVFGGRKVGECCMVVPTTRRTKYNRVDKTRQFRRKKISLL